MEEKSIVILFILGTYCLLDREREGWLGCPPNQPVPSPVINTCHIEQSSRGNHLLLVVVFVTEEDDLGDPRLDDQLGTLVAREQSHVHLTTFHI